jgi:hypothetical protein
MDERPDFQGNVQSKPEKQGFFRSSFGSALLGGAVVAVVGAILLLTGAVKSSGGGTTTIEQSSAAPIVSKSDVSDEGGNTVDEIYKADGDGVAFIESELEATETESFNPFIEPESQSGGTATGSGIVIDEKGHILTNNHVIEGASKIEVKLGESDHQYTAEVVGTDPASDLALIQVDAPTSELDPLTLGDSSKMEVGDPVVAIGNPFGLDRTVTSGIVSGSRGARSSPNWPRPSTCRSPKASSSHRSKRAVPRTRPGSKEGTRKRRSMAPKSSSVGTSSPRSMARRSPGSKSCRA